MILLEVIATTVADACRAEAGGANRIELVTGLLEGGLTPSYGLVDEVVAAVQIPVHVMIRPHSQSFVYSSADVRVMLQDIRGIRPLGVAGFVLGALTDNGTIDMASMAALIDAAEGTPVTFHRAFDTCANRLEAVRELLELSAVTRVLTSGGQMNASHATEEIKNLVQATNGRPLTVMAGSGLTAENLPSFVQATGVEEVHVGTGARTGGDAQKPVDVERVRLVRAALDR